MDSVGTSTASGGDELAAGAYDDGDVAGAWGEAAPPALAARKTPGAPLPRGALRPRRRRAVAPGAVRPDGGARRAKGFLLWRERHLRKLRADREAKWWSNVRAPPGLLEPIVLDVDSDDS